MAKVTLFGREVIVDDKEEFIRRVNEKLEEKEFPFIWSSRDDWDKLFENVLKYRPLFHSKPFRIPNVISGNEFWSLYPPRFRGLFITIVSGKDNFEKYNILAEKYNEESRMKSIGFGASSSPYSQWENKTERIKFVREAFDERVIDYHSLREAIFKLTPEARSGKITNYISMYHIFKSINVLDMAAAWGERLISAMASDTVIHYVGVDPNKNLYDGWERSKQELIHMARESRGSWKRHCNFININSGIENVVFPKGLYYDTVLFSPPPFVGEQYSSREGQSIDTFDNFEDWFVEFMIKSISRVSDVMTDGGYMAITILDRPKIPKSDARSKKMPGQYKIVELLMASIDYKCRDLHYSGVIAWETDSGKTVPWWIWRKRVGDNKRFRVEKAKKIIQSYPPDIVKKIEDFTHRPKTKAPLPNPSIDVHGESVKVRDLIAETETKSDLVHLEDMKKNLEDSHPGMFNRNHFGASDLKSMIKDSLWDVILNDFKN